MKICANCFNDFDIKERINSLNFYGICDVHKKKERIFDTNSEDTLGIKSDFAQLIDMYKVINGKTLTTPKTIIDRLQSDWRIFAKMDEENLNRLLRALLSDKYEEDDEIFYRPIQMEKLENKKFREKNSILVDGSWPKFKEYLFHKNRFFNNSLNTKVLLKILGWSEWNAQEYQNKEYFRARIVDDFDEVTSVKDMLIPPIKKRDYTEGRLNARGIGLLYLATSSDIAIKEIRAAFKDRVVFIKGKLQKKVKVVDLSNLDNLSPFRIGFNSDFPAVYQLNRKCCQEMVNDLEKPINTQRKGPGLNYLPTQYLSSLIQTKYDGIKYKSTIDNNNKDFNLVLFNDDNIDFDFSNLQRIEIKNINYSYE